MSAMKTVKRIAISAFAFVFGVLVIPAVPFMVAAMAWNDSDGKDVPNDRG